MTKIAREKQLDSKALALPDRLRRKKTTAKNDAETVTVKLGGGKEVSEIELDYKKLKITKKDALLLAEEIKIATNRALDKYTQSVSREIEKLGK
jgi:DNA-binding protein YbaB